MKKILIFLVIAASSLALFFYSKYQHQINTPVDPGNVEQISFIVKNGDTSQTIISNLKSKNLILDPLIFKIFIKLNNYETAFKPGRFILTKSLTPKEIVAILSDPTERQVIITIPEGSTIMEIDQKLAELSLIKPGEFSAYQHHTSTETRKNLSQKYPFLSFLPESKLIFPLEGYLFPDTYFVSANNFSPAQLENLMLNNFQQKTSKYDLTKLNEKIIIASMIEKEALFDEDRGIISGIIHNRIDQNWLLGIDATLLYLKQDREIDYQDLQEKSEYNTRNSQGLPPGPIANPGAESIKAAFNPEKTEYMYYLADPKGHNHYAKTLDEHNSNKRKYLN